MRVLETAVGADGRLKEYEGWTSKFIFPPYDFRFADSLITNFHMPYSTMLMLTAAYGGYENVMHAYESTLCCRLDKRASRPCACLLVIYGD